MNTIPPKLIYFWLTITTIECLWSLWLYFKARKDERGVSRIRIFITLLPFSALIVCISIFYGINLSESTFTIIMLGILYLFPMLSSVEKHYRNSSELFLKTVLLNSSAILLLVAVSYLFEIIPAGMFIAGKSANLLERGSLWLIPPFMLYSTFEDFGRSINDEYDSSVYRKLSFSSYKIIGAHIISLLVFALFLNKGEFLPGVMEHKRYFTMSPYIMSTTDILAGLAFFLINIFLYYQIIKPHIKIKRTALIGAILLLSITIEMLLLLLPNMIYAMFLIKTISFILMSIYQYVLKRILGNRLIENTA
ncbi:MAG: hypothetical protein ACYC27_16880 [Armatimonadota bacterium]